MSDDTSLELLAEQTSFVFLDVEQIAPDPDKFQLSTRNVPFYKYLNKGSPKTPVPTANFSITNISNTIDGLIEGSIGERFPKILDVSQADPYFLKTTKQRDKNITRKRAVANIPIKVSRTPNNFPVRNPNAKLTGKTFMNLPPTANPFPNTRKNLTSKNLPGTNVSPDFGSLFNMGLPQGQQPSVDRQASNPVGSLFNMNLPPGQRPSVDLQPRPIQVHDAQKYHNYRNLNELTGWSAFQNNVTNSLSTDVEYLATGQLRDDSGSWVDLLVGKYGYDQADIDAVNNRTNLAQNDDTTKIKIIEHLRSLPVYTANNDAQITEVKDKIDTFINNYQYQRVY